MRLGEWADLSPIDAKIECETAGQAVWRVLKSSRKSITLLESRFVHLRIFLWLLFWAYYIGRPDKQSFELWWNESSSRSSTKTYKECSHRKCICMLARHAIRTRTDSWPTRTAAPATTLRVEKDSTSFALRATATAGSFPRAPTRMAWL